LRVCQWERVHGVVRLQAVKRDTSKGGVAAIHDHALIGAEQTKNGRL
jgi:hypothetical protein